MKVYIAVDMEGIGGVAVRAQVLPGDPEYQRTRHLLTQEVNAAVEGALKGGATEVLVWDNHDGGLNLLLEEAHPDARYAIGGPHVSRFPGLDPSFDGVYLVGYHARSGTSAAVRDHTFSSATWQELSLNGRALGEVGIDGLWCGSLGVPVLLVTGDDKVCAEAREVFGEIETAVVKQGLGRHLAITLSPQRSRELVRAAAGRALARVGAVRPLTAAPPYEVRLKLVGTDLVDGRYFDGKRIARLDGQTILFRSDDLREVLSLAR